MSDLMLNRTMLVVHEFYLNLIYQRGSESVDLKQPALHSIHPNVVGSTYLYVCVPNTKTTYVYQSMPIFFGSNFLVVFVSFN